MATDAVLLLAYAVGQAKETLKGHGHPGVPHFAHDVLRYSVLRKANQAIAPAQEWKPTRDSK
jgi:hypothetical protein